MAPLVYAAHVVAALLASKAEMAMASGSAVETDQSCVGSGQGAEAEDLALLQHGPAHGVGTAAAEEKRGFICNTYEVCQCESGPEESSTACRKGTCRFDRDFSMRDYCYYSTPDCDDWEDWPAWDNCHWANFGPAGKLPGDNNILMALDGKSLSPSLLDTLTRVTVFTDVDDTLICSGGGVAGVDTVCEGTAFDELYPGVVEFQLALALGPSGALPKQLVVPLSARPWQLKAVMKIEKDGPINRAFKLVGGDDWGLDVDHALYGDLPDDIDIVSKTLGDAGLTPYRSLAYTKYKGWREAVAEEPFRGAASIFVGDDGQGDLVAAQMMAKSGRLLAAFVHDVRGECREASCQTAWAEYGIFLFSNYVEAAGVAFSRGIISRESCRKVCSAERAKLYTCQC
mmetsp:Transcript_86514/g.268834  ORF Transcript_86514/g.268834 Transcript_86514/m.268834 type:complete len:399 (+) Transcript_86514:46-1242(+)